MSEDFEMAKTELNAFFDPQKNVEHVIYMFWQAKQSSAAEEIRKESKPPVLLKPEITKSVHTDSKMSDNALDKYLLPNYNEGDDGTLSGVLPLPKTPDYRPVQDDYDLMEHSGIDDQDEASPPPSQPRRVRVERAEHPIPARKPEKSEKKENNPPERKREEKRGSKRKYVDQRSVEAKIAKTEESIYKLQRHLNNRTCPKSLQYAARANITPDGDFLFEVAIGHQGH
ncbi:hypothetical protein ACROYT_G015936 [Oculina patagonica]